MNLLNWLRRKLSTPSIEDSNASISKENEDSKKKNDPQEQLWQAENSSDMKSLISRSTDNNLNDLVNAIMLADFPLNALTSAGDSIDKRSSLTIHFTFQLLKAGKYSQANQLLTKVINKMQSKLYVGMVKGDIIPNDKEQAFESAFTAGDTKGAADLLKQYKGTDFWHIDEILKQEIYDLSMEMLRMDRAREAAILLDAVMLDYPEDLNTEFWRAVAYHNIFNDNKSNDQAKNNAKKAVSAFLTKAEGNPKFAQKCSDLRNIISSYKTL